MHRHYIQHWFHGGETSVDNLVLLCTAHHHPVHEGGWSVSRAQTGDLRFAALASNGVEYNGKTTMFNLEAGIRYMFL